MSLALRKTGAPLLSAPPVHSDVVRHQFSSSLLSLPLLLRIVWNVSCQGEASSPKTTPTLNALLSTIVGCTRQGPHLSIRIGIWSLPSDTDDFYCICFDHPNRETAMLSRWLGSRSTGMSRLSLESLRWIQIRCLILIKFWILVS